MPEPQLTNMCRVLLDLFNNGPASNHQLADRIEDLDVQQIATITRRLAIQRKIRRKSQDGAGHVFEHCEVNELPPKTQRGRTHSPEARLADRKPSYTPFGRSGALVQTNKKIAFLRALLNGHKLGSEQEDLVIGIIADYEGLKKIAS